MDRDNRTRTGAKDPWGRAATPPLAQRLAEARPGPDTEPGQYVVGKRAKGRCKLRADAGMPGVGLTAEACGKARPERLALKPYRGKPAVRNFREGDGDGGIMRSPLRAIALPDPVYAYPQGSCSGKDAFDQRNSVNRAGNVTTAVSLRSCGSWRSADGKD